MDLRLAVSAAPGSLCEMQILRPLSSPLSQNLHFNSNPRPFVGTVKGKKLWSFTVLGIPSWNTYFSLSLPCPLSWFASLLPAWRSPSLPPGSRWRRDNGFILMSPKCILVKMSYKIQFPFDRNVLKGPNPLSRFRTSENPHTQENHL